MSVLPLYHGDLSNHVWQQAPSHPLDPLTRPAMTLAQGAFLRLGICIHFGKVIPFVSL